MRYTNATRRLPQDLIEQIQEYVQGEYLYIPIKDRKVKNAATNYKIELEKRDAHIFTKYLEGINRREIAQLYNLSESSVRRIIIKQKGRFKDMYKEIRELLIHWNLERAEIQQVYDSAWYVGNENVLKVYDAKEMLERNLKVLTVLEKRNIPVAHLVGTNDNQSYVEQEGKYYLLSKRLPGNNIVDLSQSKGLAKVMGQTVAKLHQAFKECEGEGGFWENSLLGEMNSWVRESFEKNEWQDVSREAFEATVDSLEKYYDTLPVQLIHRDVHFGNFLFEQSVFSGYIDFDLSQRNIRIFDLCYFLLGLLSEEEKIRVTEKEWLLYVQDAFAGYEEINKLTEEEKKAVPFVMESIELLFAAYFMNEKDTVCSADALRLFHFVKERENIIYQSLIKNRNSRNLGL